MLYFGLYVQLRRGSVAGYTTDESWAYGPKEGVEAFESITFFIRFIYAINFEHLLIEPLIHQTYFLQILFKAIFIYSIILKRRAIVVYRLWRVRQDARYLCTFCNAQTY